MAKVIRKAAKTARKTAKRPRNAAATRLALLKAARSQFSQHGYELVGLRQIAAEAGVNQALAIRYFGSKKALFEAALEGVFWPHVWLEGDRKTSGRRVAEWVACKWEPYKINPLTMLVQSCGHPEANDALRKAFDAQAIKQMAAWLGGEDAVVRAGLLASLVVGTGVVGQLLKSRSLAQSERETIIETLGMALQKIVDNAPSARLKRAS